MMGMNCEHIRNLLNQWESGEILTSEEYSRIASHIEECPSCRENYGAVLPFLSRDAESYDAQASGGKSVKHLFSDETTDVSADFTDRVMAAIEKEKPRKPKKDVWRYIAVAAAVLIVGGFGLTVALKTFLTPAAPAQTAAAPKTSATVYVQVRFTLTAGDAESVALVGDFTEWNTSEIVLEDPEGDGIWEVEIQLRKGDVYEYNFVIDGEEWIPDPNALMQVDDGFGGQSSLLTL